MKSNFTGGVERSTSTRRPQQVHAQYRAAVLADHARWLAEHEARALRLSKTTPATSRAIATRTVGVML